MLTFAFCTYNRAERLERLVAAMRSQACPLPFEILAVNNNSRDHTVDVLRRLAALPGAPLRWVTEPVQGIVSARNRGIAEAMDRDILVFIDDDEIPLPGLIAGAADAILNEGAQCAGGRIEVDFTSTPRPRWLDDDVVRFLGFLDHGPAPIWIGDESTAVWCGNVAYDMKIFRDDPQLRFDKRYDRVGNQVGGGEDVAMFRTLVERGARIRYRPDMAVLHDVEAWRLQRRYFLQLHYRGGVRAGQFRLPDYRRKVFGIPPFLLGQFLRQTGRAAAMALARRPGALRQAMNAAHAWGSMVGYGRRG